MLGSLLAVLLVTVQPEDPVLQSDVSVEVEAAVPDEVSAGVEADVRADAEPRQPVVAEEPPSREEEIVCRRRLAPSERIGQRHRVIRDCRTRAEWDETRNRRD